MPKATLTFDLPEEREEFETTVKAADYLANLHDIDNSLRNYLKHGHSFKTPENVMEWVREHIIDIW